jgi:hypothetical protein
MVIEMDRKGIFCPLGRYPRVRELVALLARLEAGGRWEWSDFCGYINPVAGELATRFCFLHPDEWWSLQDLWSRALVLPESPGAGGIRNRTTPLPAGRPRWKTSSPAILVESEEDSSPVCTERGGILTRVPPPTQN